MKILEDHILECSPSCKSSKIKKLMLKKWKSSFKWKSNNNNKKKEKNKEKEEKNSNEEFQNDYQKELTSKKNKKAKKPNFQHLVTSQVLYIFSH